MLVEFPKHIPFEQIAKEIGTPTFVFDIDHIQRRLSRVKKAFPETECDVFYSIKANSNHHIIKLASAAHFGIDICSEGDLWVAEHCGVQADQMTCTGVALTNDFMKMLGDRGIRTNLDSFSELKRWVRVTESSPVGIRIAPDVRAGFSEHCQGGNWGGKLGFSIAEARTLLCGEDACGKLIRGIHMHIGSGILDTAPHLKAVKRLLPLFSEFDQLEYFNIGGGFGTSYHDDEDEIPIEILADEVIKAVQHCAENRGKPIRLELEPGEFIAAPAGYLLARVLVKKEWVHPDKRKEALILDASMNHFPAGVLYGSMNRMYLARAPEGHRCMQYDVYGNTNQSGDRFGGPRELPVTNEGDLIVLGSCGAYASCRGSNFNEHPLAPEVIMRNGEFSLSVRRQTYSELFGRFCR